MQQGDIAGHQYAYHDRGHVHEFQHRAVTFYSNEQWYRSPDLSVSAAEDTTPFVKVPIPDDSSIGTFGDQATLELRSEWAPPKAPAGRKYAAGSLLTAPLADVLEGDWSRASALFEPEPATSLLSVSKQASKQVSQ